MLQLQVIPIKNHNFKKLFINTNLISPSKKTIKNKNVKNFLFMRTASQSERRRQNFGRKTVSSLNKNQILTERKRPQTSNQSYCEKGLSEADHFNLEINANPQNILISRTSQLKPSITTHDSNSLNLKNCFPLRKPKKNNNLKWHQYFTLLNTKQYTLYLPQRRGEISRNNLLERSKKQKTKTSTIQEKKPPIKKNKPSFSFDKYIPEQISPWNTEGLEKVHIQHSN